MTCWEILCNKFILTIVSFYQYIINLSDNLVQTPFCPLDIFPHLGEDRDGGQFKIFNNKHFNFQTTEQINIKYLFFRIQIFINRYSCIFIKPDFKV